MFRWAFALRRLLVVLAAVLLLCTSSSRASAQTPSAWRAQDMAVDSFGNARVMWRHTSGRIVLWRVINGVVYNTVAHGTDSSGWKGEALAVGGDGKSRVIWNNDDGTIAVWTATEEGQYESIRPYGPYNDGNGLTWKAIDIAVDSGNRMHVLLKRTDNVASVQVIDPAKLGNPQYRWDSAVRLTGPAGAVPKAITVDPQGNTRLMWQWQQSGSGMLMWVVPPGASTPSIQYSDGPFGGWMPMDQAAPSDGTTRTFWDRTSDGALSLRILTTSGINYFNYEVPAGWRGQSLSYRPSYNEGRLMLNNINGTMALWSLAANGSYSSHEGEFNFVPQDLAATSRYSAVHLKWSASSFANANNSYTYRVSRGTSASGPFTALVQTNLTSYNDHSATPGTLYYYKVTTLSNLLESGDSNIVSLTPASGGGTSSFLDDFDDRTYTSSLWDEASVRYPTYYTADQQQRTRWGNPLQFLQEGSTSYVRLKLETYNPYNSSLLYGSQLMGKIGTAATVQAPTVGEAVEFEARLRTGSLQSGGLADIDRGAVSAFWTYYNNATYPTFDADEIDFEWVGGNSQATVNSMDTPQGDRPINEIMLTSWSNWTNSGPYNDGTRHRSRYISVTDQSYNRTQWFYYKIRWVCELNGARRVEWYLRRTTADQWFLIRRTDDPFAPGPAPSRQQRLALNIWAPSGADSPGWVAVDEGALPPTTQAQNRTNVLDVDYVQVRRMPASQGAASATTSGDSVITAFIPRSKSAKQG